MHQIALMVAYLRIFWRTYIARNEIQNHEDCDLVEVIEAKESTRRESTVCLGSEIDKTNAKIDNLYGIIEKWKNESRTTEIKKQQEMERRMEQLECKLSDVISMKL